MKINEIILQELSEGKIEAFDYLFNRYYTSLYAFARRYLNDQNEAEDVVCSLFVHLWETRSNLINIREIESYLITSIHNTCLNRIRENSSRKKREETFFNSNSINLELQEAEHIENKIDRDILSRIIKEVSQALPDKCREILKLRREENFTYKEIAQKLNISVGTVKTQLSRANNKIKEALKNYTFSLFL
ncbi:MAG: RNA polymerase sigma-70 factor [Rikenellaceae bacterium]